MIYFLDGNQEVIKIVRSSAVISAIQTQELPEDNSLLRDYLSVRLKNDERLFNAQYMAIKSYGGNRNAFDLYRIASELVPDNATEFMGVQVAPYELEGVVIEDLRPQNRPLNQTMNQVLEGSDWRLGYISDNLSNVTTNFYYMSVKDALKKIQELTNVEMLFKVEISGNKITDKWVEVYHQLGNRTMKRFNYRTNALSVVRESSHDELYTALIGRGKGEEVGETQSGDAAYGRKINFADVEWKKSAGNPVDKPKGQKYIELQNATAEYGIKLIDGRKVPRIGIVDFSETDDSEKLIQQTYQELLVRARPKVLFKASVINTGDMLIGDTVTIHRHDLGFHYQARVRKVVRDRKNNNQTQVEIGDVVHTPSTKRQGQINSALNNVASDLENVREEITEARSSADGKNTNFYGNVEPERKKVGDTWFRDHPSLTGESQILVWNGEAWELIMDTSETTKNTDAIREQQKEIDLAKEVADEALSEIDTAIKNAGFTSLDDTIKSVQSRANTAFDTANDLIGEVSGYSQTVDGFNQTVNNYTNQVANFRLDVDGFSSAVASYSADVRDYSTQVSTLTNEVSGFNSTVANIDGRVTSLSTTVNGISSTVSGLGDRVSSVEQTASGLQSTVASKASQTQVTQLSDALSSVVEDTPTNLVTNSSLESVEGWSIPSSITVGNHTDTGRLLTVNTPGARIYNLGGNFEPGKTYYISFKMHVSSGSAVVQVGSHNDSNRPTVIVGGVNGNRSHQLVYKPTVSSSYFSIYFMNTGAYRFQDLFISDAPFAEALGSQISQLSDNINLRVTKGELLSQINIEAERTLIQSDKLLLNATNTVITGTAWMDGAVIANASIDGAKIQDATIGSAKIARLDVNKISGNTAEFVRVGFNGVNSWMQLDSDGIHMSGSGSWRQTYVTPTGFDLYNGVGSSNKAGAIGYFKEHPNSANSIENYMRTTEGGQHFVGIGVNRSHSFAVGYNEYTTTPNGYDPALVVSGLTGNISLLRSTTMGNGIRLWFNGGSYIGEAANSQHFNINAKGQIRLYNSIDSLKVQIGANFDMYSDLNMNSNNIYNNSDVRLKKNITPTGLKSLDVIKQWNFVDYEWRDERFKGTFMGVIAQDTPEIASYNEETGFYAINSSKQLMMTTHALHELALNHDGVAQLAKTNESKIHKLQQELSKANRRIEELEGVI